MRRSFFEAGVGPASSILPLAGKSQKCGLTFIARDG